MAEFGNNSNNTTSSRFPFFSRSLTTVHRPNTDTKPLLKAQNLERTASLRGKVVKKLCSLFEPPKPAPPENFAAKLKALKSAESPYDGESFSSGKLLKPPKSVDSSPVIRLPGAEDRIVLYFTSLRGIRRTYEDCYAVRMIFRGFRVWVDERDVSMDCAYKKELMGLFGEKNMRNVVLPQVFIRGRHLGGAEVIKQLCEVGELGKMLEGLPRTKPGFVCESCGDMRFVPCGNCSGSRKVFDEDEGLLKRCFQCNENGLLRCPNCSSN